MTVDISFREKPWQNAAVGSRNKLNALFNDGHISDLTITFPGKDIRYKAHKVILAMSSSVFEGMLFGPMAIKGSELELPDDNPEAFKIVLAHCYEVTIVASDIDVALDVYMMADKYFLEQLGEVYSYYIGNMLNSDNINKVLEFASNFNFNSLKVVCYEIFCLKFECDVTDSSKALLVLRQEWLKELLGSGISIRELKFEDSWEYPDETLCEDTIIKILKSKSCRNQGLRKLSGCVSAKVVNSICWDVFEEEEELDDYNELYLSFTNHQQANEIMSLLQNINAPRLYIHLQCKMIPADRLGQIPPHSFGERNPYLFLSNVDDNGIDWVVSAISSLVKPPDGYFEFISFPRSKLTFRGLTKLLTELAVLFDNDLPEIEVCSSEIPSNKENEIKDWLNYSIQIDQRIGVRLFDRNENYDGW